jgi:hypothetical protein
MRDLALASPDDRLRVFAACRHAFRLRLSGLMKRPTRPMPLIEMAQAHGLDQTRLDASSG